MERVNIMNNPTMTLIEPMTSLLENKTSVGDMLPSPYTVALAPIAPSSMNNLMMAPKIVQEVAQSNIINNNLSNLGLPGLIPLNAGAIGSSVINAGTTASSNMIDANIIAGTGLFPPLGGALPFTNTASAIPSQANIINGIFPSTTLPGLNNTTSFSMNANVPRSNIINGSVPFVNLPGFVSVGQPNIAMNQNFLNSGVSGGVNTGFMNAFNTGGFGGGFGGFSVSEPYGLLSIIGAVILYIAMRRKKNIFLGC